MKGGDVILLFALRALHEAGHLADAQIIVALTGDEELTGKPISLSRKDLIDAGKRGDIALGFENSTGFNNVTLARRGSSGWKVEIEGKRVIFTGSFGEYFIMSLGLLVLSVITFGLAAPYWAYWNFKYFFTRMEVQH